MIKRTKLVMVNDGVGFAAKRRVKICKSVYYQWTPEEIAALNAELDAGLLARRIGALFDTQKVPLELKLAGD